MPPKVIRLQDTARMTDNQRIEAEAAEWAVRQQLRALTEAEQHELQAWLGSDPRNGGALLRAEAGWHDMSRLAALSAGHLRASAEPSTAEDSALASPPSLPVVHARARNPRIWASAAALLLVAGGAWIYFASTGQRYSTPVGSLDTVRLADGSHVTLNTATRIHVRLKDTERRIELDQGEALFQVARDPARPFVVHTGNLSIRAVGTTFSVRSDPRRVDVMVTEGAVEILDDAVPEPRVLRRIAANQRASIVDTRQVDIQTFPQDQAARQLAWRDGLVECAGEPLSFAVEEMNRHNRRRIVIDDPELAARPVIGSFRANDPVNFAATVAIALGAQSVERDDAIHLQLRRAQ